MISYLWTMCRAGLSTLFYSIYTVYRGRGGNSDAYHHYAVEWGKQMVNIMDMDLEVIGKEHLSPDENYVYVANHSSLLDIPVLIYGLDDNVRIIYKKELENIPIFGWGMKQSPFIPVSRGDGGESMKSLNEAISAMKESKSILIYPEGTRSVDGTLGEFKRGAFVLAEKAGKKIVPVTVIGTNKILPKGTTKILKGAKVRIIISEPMELPAERHKRAMMAYIDTIRTIILENLTKHSEN